MEMEKDPCVEFSEAIPLQAGQRSLAIHAVTLDYLSWKGLNKQNAPVLDDPRQAQFLQLYAASSLLSKKYLKKKRAGQESILLGDLDTT